MTYVTFNTKFHHSVREWCRKREMELACTWGIIRHLKHQNRLKILRSQLRRAHNSQSHKLTKRPKLLWLKQVEVYGWNATKLSEVYSDRPVYESATKPFESNGNIHLTVVSVKVTNVKVYTAVSYDWPNAVCYSMRLRQWLSIIWKRCWQFTEDVQRRIDPQHCVVDGSILQVGAVGNPSKRRQIAKSGQLPNVDHRWRMISANSKYSRWLRDLDKGRVKTSYKSLWGFQLLRRRFSSHAPSFVWLYLKFCRGQLPHAASDRVNFSLQK